MIREYIVRIDDSLKNADKDIDELETKWGAEELPKGHGKLIDAVEYENNIRKYYFDNDTVIRCTELALHNAKPIIEADTEEESEDESENE